MVALAGLVVTLASPSRLWEVLSVGALATIGAAIACVLVPGWEARALCDERDAVLVAANSPKLHTYKMQLAVRTEECVGEADLERLRMAWFRVFLAAAPTQIRPH
jgi:hypothetical protein